MKKSINEKSTRRTGEFLSFKEARKAARTTAYESGYYGFIYRHGDNTYSVLDHTAVNKDWEYIATIDKSGAIQKICV